MFSASGILVVCGLVCIGIGVYIFQKLRPREGQPPSPWASSDFRGSSVAMGLLILFLAGITLVAKGFSSG